MFGNVFECDMGMIIIKRFQLKKIQIFLHGLNLVTLQLSLYLIDFVSFRDGVFSLLSMTPDCALAGGENLL